MLRPRASVLDLPTYQPPLGSREGLRLDFNENTFGCSPRVLERLRRLRPDDLAKYPEREPVEKIVAAHLGISSGELLLTNGVDEAIHLLCQSFLTSGDEAIIPAPTFAMYEISAAAAGARVIRVPAADEFRFPVTQVLAAINDRTRLVAIANPNNPTGAVAAPDEVLAICKAAPDAAVLIDEAYFHFYGQTMLHDRFRCPNLFVARTFSKAYGLAGLRIGLLAGDAEAMKWVRKLGSPYSVNGVALACLPEALADQSFVRSYVDQVIQGRERLQNELGAWGLKYWPSQANFVLVRLGALNRPFIDAMRKQGILVRDRSADLGCDGCVRITIGTLEQTEFLLRVLPEVFDQIGLRQAEAV